jgi:putative transposase
MKKFKSKRGGTKIMILTYKIKHNCDFSKELYKARKIAEFAIKTHSRSSADVKHIGLKSAIANQILKKYSRNKDCNRVRRVVLTIPNKSVNVNKEDNRIMIPCLHLKLTYMFRNDFSKVNQIEIDKEYAYISVSIQEPPLIETDHFIGIDRNTTHHCAVVADPISGKIWKLGKQAEHTHKKYKGIRKALQAKGKLKKLKQIKRRESNKVKDINHKVSRKIVDTAKVLNCGIKMERLGGIQNNRKHHRMFKYSLHSWGFYQLQNMVEYKAKLSGIPVVYIEPAWTSQQCSKCGLIGNRNKLKFSCPHCGHVEDANVNASFNIALRPTTMAIVPWSDFIPQLHIDRDMCKGSTDAPKGATL